MDPATYICPNCQDLFGRWSFLTPHDLSWHSFHEILIDEGKLKYETAYHNPCPKRSMYVWFTYIFKFYQKIDQTYIGTLTVWVDEGGCKVPQNAQQMTRFLVTARIVVAEACALRVPLDFWRISGRSLPIPSMTSFTYMCFRLMIHV